jgi:hypothetical protein
MVLDPLTAIGLAGNIVQFTDFSIKIVGKAHHINKSASGLLPESADAEMVAQALISLNEKIKVTIPSPSTGTQLVLQELCNGCDNVARELVAALEKLKVQGNRTKWKSLRQALKSVLSKDRLDNISKRLADFRDQLSLNFLVTLRYVA